MMMRLAILFLVAIPCFAQGICPSGLPVTGNHCYFVSAGGADPNSGTSEAAPWLHAPGMPNCSSTCLSVWNTTLPANTGIIFRGGDTWHFGISSDSAGNPASGGVWGFNSTQKPNGTSFSAPIYIGADPTWDNSGVCGGTWCRPIFNADNPRCNASTLGANCFSGSYPGGFYYVGSCAYQVPGGNNFFDLTSRKYYIVDNIEMTGLCTSQVGQPNDVNDYFIYGGANGPLKFTNDYIHGWSHLQFAGANGSGACTGSTVCFSSSVFYGTVLSGPGEIIQNVVVDGSDSDGIGTGLCYCGFYDVSQSVFRYTSQTIVRDIYTFHDNLYEYFFENGHSNVLESINDPANTTVYNNIFRHMETTGGTGGVLLWMEPPVSSTTWIFNNLFYDIGSMEFNNIGQSGSSTGSYTYFNNTFQTSVSQPIMRCEYLTGGTFSDINNHYVTDAGVYISGCTPGVLTTPKTMTNAAATTAGYTNSETFAYSPPTAGSATVGAGTSAASVISLISAAGFTAAAIAAGSDTTYACSYNTSNHTVTCPGRTPIARPSPPSVGDYEFASAPATVTAPCVACMAANFAINEAGRKE